MLFAPLTWWVPRPSRYSAERDPAGGLALGPGVPRLHRGERLVELLGQRGAVLRRERALGLALVERIDVAAVAVPAERRAVAGGVAEPRRLAGRRLLGLVGVEGGRRPRSRRTAGRQHGDDRSGDGRHLDDRPVAGAATCHVVHLKSSPVSTSPSPWASSTLVVCKIVLAERKDNLVDVRSGRGGPSPDRPGHHDLPLGVSAGDRHGRRDLPDPRDHPVRPVASSAWAAPRGRGRGGPPSSTRRSAAGRRRRPGTGGR